MQTERETETYQGSSEGRRGSNSGEVMVAHMTSPPPQINYRQERGAHTEHS